MGMDRRDFLEHTTRAAAVLPFLKLPDFFKGTPMGIVVHSYAFRWNSNVESKKYPGFSDAIQLMEHCHTIGAGGIQVGVKNWSREFAKKVAQKSESLGMYVEGSIALPAKEQDREAFEAEVVNAKASGASILRTVCLSGRRYENFSSPEDFQSFRKNSLLSLQLAEPVVRKHKMKLAVENHKDWRAGELVETIQAVNSEWVGVTLDFGNSISLMEDPMEVIAVLAPFIFSTHVKDMGVAEYDKGFLLSEVPLGKGLLDLPGIIATCRQHNPGVSFNLEMITRDPLKIPCLTDEFWSTFHGVGALALARTLRMVRSHAWPGSLPEVSHLDNEGKLAFEEENIIASLLYSKNVLGLK
jgi:sugar phosphate isomerase/epimerase